MILVLGDVCSSVLEDGLGSFLFFIFFINWFPAVHILRHGGRSVLLSLFIYFIKGAVKIGTNVVSAPCYFKLHSSYTVHYENGFTSHYPS